MLITITNRNKDEWQLAQNLKPINAYGDREKISKRKLLMTGISYGWAAKKFIRVRNKLIRLHSIYYEMEIQVHTENWLFAQYKINDIKNLHFDYVHITHTVNKSQPLFWMALGEFNKMINIYEIILLAGMLVRSFNRLNWTRMRRDCLIISHHSITRVHDYKILLIKLIIKMV